MTQEIYNIHAYDLVTFVQEIEKAVKLGFEVDLHGIDNHPRMIGYQFLMRLVKGAEKKVTLGITVDTAQVQEQVQKLQDKIEEAQAAGVTDVDVAVPEVKVEAKKPGRKPKGE